MCSHCALSSPFLIFSRSIRMCSHRVLSSIRMCSHCALSSPFLIFSRALALSPSLFLLAAPFAFSPSILLNALVNCALCSTSRSLKVCVGCQKVTCILLHVLILTPYTPVETHTLKHKVRVGCQKVTWARCVGCQKVTCILLHGIICIF